MGLVHRQLGHRTTIAAVAIVLTILIYWWRSSGIASLELPSKFKMSDQDDSQQSLVDQKSPLSVSISQKSISPLAIILKVSNTGPEPLTFVKWNSPLDPLALQLRLLTIAPAGSNTPLEYPAIKIRRAMPPPVDAYITLKPGESEGQEVVLTEPIIPLELLKNAAGQHGNTMVKCTGTWMAVWSGDIGTLSKDNLENVIGGNELTHKMFGSNWICISV
jgi:hypothetical protein